MAKQGGRVFTSPNSYEHKGIFLRDYIAIEAMKSIITSWFSHETNIQAFVKGTKEDISKMPYEYADAMILYKDEDK
ncbi:MAG: hypothetical protein A2Z57_11155 [Planctomycetes bacterium RIFCSPHIGHO2_12_39_6]|nr:MAG: hypothetical protein A2Z57_11155 [Planctomycetes bacterium RIFCSPHIGHO2_12_39_6]